MGKSGEILVSVETAPKTQEDLEILSVGTDLKTTTELENVSVKDKIVEHISFKEDSSIETIISSKEEDIEETSTTTAISHSIIIEPEVQDNISLTEKDSGKEQPVSEIIESIPAIPVKEYDPICGEYAIKVIVKKAKNLQKKGLMGKPDPYVKISYGDYTSKSKTIKNTYKPDWSYSTNVVVSDTTPKNLLIEVYDEDVGKDDFMGQVSMDIDELVHKQNLTDQWIPLSICNSGEILVSVETAPKVVMKLEKVPDGTAMKTSTELDNLSVEDKIVEHIYFEEDSSIETTVPSKEKDIEETSTTKVKSDSIIIESEMQDSVSLTEKESVKEQPVIEIIESKPTIPVEKYDPICGEYDIKVIVKKAKNLQEKGLMGKPDPYVKITYGDCTSKI